MSHLTTDDGVRLYYEETGLGTPVVFVHELAGDLRSYEPQVRYFSRYYRCIAYNARGYPPSDVPEGADAYSQDRARNDIRAVLDALAIDKAHVVGLSMGGFAALHFGITYPQRARSLVIAGCGYGAAVEQRQQFAEEAEQCAILFETLGAAAAERLCTGPTRVQYQNKDPRGWREMVEQFQERSAQGIARTLRGVQARRPSVFALGNELKTITTPTLIVTGDEDWPCLEPALFMKRMIATAGLVVLPNTGHGVNLEEPAAFNQQLRDFFHAVDCAKWPSRDPRALASSIL
jgi:pimeloyl-ACP methyl ester carboxylesterase